MRHYSADQIELSWKGLDLKPGLATGTFVQEARSEPDFTIKPAGAVSTVTRVHSVNKSGTVTIQVDMESQLHQSLKAIRNADVTPGSQNQVDDMVLVDASNGEEITWINAFISTMPDRSRGVEGGVGSWVFFFERSRDTEIDPLLNAVGG